MHVTIWKQHLKWQSLAKLMLHLLCTLKERKKSILKNMRKPEKIGIKINFVVKKVKKTDNYVEVTQIEN